ncbi:glycosyltransferase [Bradyrhizobium neotropicale]|nr:glycosyltransferase [Bradyrhizobium neotropicale]
MTVRKLAVIVIGRNEGERLAKCLMSVIAIGTPVLYVDSGSTDGSVAMARGAGIDVVELDTGIPFTAARARKEGFERVLRLVPDLSYVQFVDGDCEVVAGFIEKAMAFLDTHHDVAVVCGRLRERYPQRSIYNRICDIEWDAPVGDTDACGGNALMRVDAVESVGGYRADLTTGEEPELCGRLRAAGWRVWRLDAEMVLHDAAMVRFGQWWWRAVRSGYGNAQHAYLFGTLSRRWESLRAWLWGVWLPFACLALGVALGPLGWAAWLIYPLQWLRQTLRNPGPLGERALLALFQLGSRFPECWGQIRFMHERFLGRQRRLIEYK